MFDLSRILTKIVTPVFTAGLLLAGMPALGSLANAGYMDAPSAQKFVSELVNKHAFDESWLAGYLNQAEKKDSILKAMSRPAEKVLEWKDYRKIFITDNRIQLGKAFLKEHAATFAKAEKETGVPKEIIAAIIGVETRYGKNKGSYRVLDALATLAFDYPPRSKFFTSELEHFFLLSREQGFDPSEVKGSYAGAMGYGQFIPSSYRHYAVDFSGDGIADIVNNPVDAIGSVANYFKAHGWKQGETVVVPAKVKGEAYEALITTKQKPQNNVAELKKAGVTFEDTLEHKQSARLIKFLGDKGEEYWVGLDNFYVITRYNHSDMYAMAVFQLANSLK